MSLNEEYENNPIVPEEQPTEQGQPELGMKWFKFLIYFMLFFSALEDLLQSLVLFFNYENEFLGFEYFFYGELRWLGILFAVIWLAIAAYTIYIRFRLAKFRKGAPKQYIIYEIVNQAVFLIFSLAGEFAMGQSDMMIASMIGGVIGSVLGGFVYIYPNIIYFKKRDHLFVN